MSELVIGLLLLGAIAGFVIGLFYTPAWEGGILLALLAIFLRVERDNEKINKLLQSPRRTE
jgi:hypothetical protein